MFASFLLVLCCILLPPLAVYLVHGPGDAFCLNFFLTLLLWVPGILHAFTVIFSKEGVRVNHRIKRFKIRVPGRRKKVAVVAVPVATGVA
ncbi:hypothetical protein LTR39_003770, partial [Cryomyces antarcticus]